MSRPALVRRLRALLDSNRYGPLYVTLLAYLAAATLTRLALVVLNVDEIRPDAAAVPLALARGVLFDALVGLYAVLPLGLLLTLLPARWLRARFTRGFVSVVSFLYLFGLLYLGVAEGVFFAEFSSRFNYVAVDYLITPREVFANIRDTYPVVPVLTACALGALALFAWLRRYFVAGLSANLGWRQRGRFALAYVLPLTVGAAAVNITSVTVSDNRVLNEIAGNGIYSFFHALVSNEAGYHPIYAERDAQAVFRRTRELLAADRGRWLHPDDPTAIERTIPGRGRPRRMNVVLVLEESLGSKYVPSLHPEGPGSMTEFDKLAAEGLLFTRIYATGNRTVRGIEATHTGLPPLPGRSLVKRPGGAGVFSLPSVFRGKGYQTAFLYGGRAYFDNLRDFALANGYDRVVEQADLKRVSFETIWGACDEDLFDHALAEFDAMHASGRPFFATLLTVSNHSPFTYPKGRIAENPDEKRRDFAMRYADFALGKFMRDARTHAFFDHTLFVVLGDHGARVYGSQQIPLESYEVPVLFYAPGLIARGRRVDTLGSQIDVPPTLLAMLGWEYNSQFYGYDLLNVKPEHTRALLSHNRDVALMRGDRVAVLGVRRTVDVWDYRRDTGKFTRLPRDEHRALIDDAISYYQGAYLLFSQRRLMPLAQTPLVPMAAMAAN
jgi:phosphoglycerol transferase MdoB-like AlkP superfamily enzyme